MSCPMSSVINPLNSNEILLFYLSNKGTTGLERHNFQDNQHNPTKFADKSVADDSGAFSALTSGGLLNVYGLVKETKADASKRIAQLSPVYKLLTTPTDSWGKARGNALATTIDRDGQGFNKDHSLVINEVKLSWNRSTLNSTINGKSPLSGTNLAATYDPKLKKRLVVYQNAKTLRIIDTSSDGDDAAIPETGDSRDDTGIALVPVKSGTGVKLYLYYFASKGASLKRVVRKENGEWDESETVDPAKEAAKTTFLTATQVTGKIVLFYMAADDGQNIYVYQDDISE